VGIANRYTYKTKYTHIRIHIYILLSQKEQMLTHYFDDLHCEKETPCAELN